jgi:hypothetical protein
LWLLYYADEMTARYPPVRTCVYCKSILDRNTDKLQQTLTDVGEKEPAPRAIGRTATNSHGRSMPSPPFDMPKISFESLQNSSEATSGLRLFCSWGNTSLTGKVTGIRSLTTRATPSFYLFPIPQSSIQAADHILLYAGKDVRIHSHFGIRTAAVSHFHTPDEFHTYSSGFTCSYQPAQAA